MRILLVEDNTPLAEGIADAIAVQLLYLVDIVGDGEAAWKQIKNIEYNLILLDLMLPKLDGLSLCKRLRSQGILTPILMLTARDSSIDKVTGLDVGADDYMVKPFDLPELLARVRALLRRGDSASLPILAWGSLYLDPSSYQVFYGKQILHLTPKEYSILELFLRNGRRVLSRNLIIDHVWSFDNPPVESTVKAHIKSLRNKLRSVGAPKDLIQTVHGIGYCLKQI